MRPTHSSRSYRFKCQVNTPPASPPLTGRSGFPPPKHLHARRYVICQRSANVELESLSLPKYVWHRFTLRGKHVHPGLQGSSRQVSEIRSNFLTFASNESHENNAQPYSQPIRGAISDGIRAATVVFCFFLVKHSSPFWQATCQWHPNLFCLFVCLFKCGYKQVRRKKKVVMWYPSTVISPVFYCKLPKSCHPTLPVAFHWKENQCVFVFQVGKARMLKIARLLQLIVPVVGEKKHMPNSITSWTDDSENETEASLRPLLDGNTIQIMACFL